MTGNTELLYWKKNDDWYDTIVYDDGDFEWVIKDTAPERAQESYKMWKEWKEDRERRGVS